MDEKKLLERITVNPRIFGGKPIIRGRRLAVEHVLGMLAAGDTAEVILEGYPWLEPEDIQACLVYARRHVANDRVEPLTTQDDRAVAGLVAESAEKGKARKPGTAVGKLSIVKEDEDHLEDCGDYMP